MSLSEKANGSMTTVIIVYVCILALSGLQIVLAYQHVEGSQRVVRMLAVAVVQASLAVFFLMRLRDEHPRLRWAVISATAFVVLLMNMIWSDSFRLMHMRPFAQ